MAADRLWTAVHPAGPPLDEAARSGWVRGVLLLQQQASPPQTSASPSSSGLLFDDIFPAFQDMVAHRRRHASTPDALLAMFALPLPPCASTLGFRVVSLRGAARAQVGGVHGRR
jgi:hypothetical protein